MARVTLDQILVPLKVSGSNLIVSGSDFVVSGSSTFIQTNLNNPAITVSGSGFITGSSAAPSYISGSWTIDSYDTIGDYSSPDIEDLGT